MTSTLSCESTAVERQQTNTASRYFLGTLDPRNYIPWPDICPEKALSAERKLLSNVKATLDFQNVKVRLNNSNINTLVAHSPNTDLANRVPFVLVHDLFTGLAVWNQNLDYLVQKRPVYAFDLLGWGRSGRPNFSTDPTLIELAWVQSVEDWRRAMGIDSMILVGHGFGAYLCASYTLEHPSHVRHLVLVDAWGFLSKPIGQQSYATAWIRFIGTFVSKFNALTVLRLLAPFVMRLFRADMVKRFGSSDPEAIYDYTYQINAQTPTGETAFHNMTYDYGWPKRPMIDRFVGIDSRVPITFVLGAKSTINKEPFMEVAEFRENTYFVEAGHHVYADNPDSFNKVMAEISDLVDRNEDTVEFKTYS